jgi:hypothetical protein
MAPHIYIGLDCFRGVFIEYIEVSGSSNITVVQTNSYITFGISMPFGPQLSTMWVYLTMV